MNRRSTLMLVALATALVLTLGCPPPPEPEPECTTDNDCEIGSICEAGICEGAVCPDVWDPVGGEDGETYGNACEARAAHVTVAHPGECEQVCGGIQGLPCPDGELCDLPAGECGGMDLQGFCVERPEVCPETFEPVCGCDGVTYSNDCFRLMAGAQKGHDGECMAEPM